MILTLIAFILILGLIVFVHELGHFLVAKKSGVTIEEFGLGFPPRLIKKKIKGTIYSINLIPLGGFVKIKGETGDHTNDPDSFQQKKIWQRLLIVSAGVLMNFFLTIILISLGYFLGLPSTIDDSLGPQAKIKQQQLQIIELVKTGPATKAGLTFGDIILTYDNQANSDITAFQEYLKNNQEKKIDLKIKRGNEILNFTVKPEIIPDYLTFPSLGITLAETGIISYPWYQSLWLGIKTTVILTGKIIEALALIIKNLVITRQMTAEIAGPVGIAILTGQVVNLGFIYVLQFTALLSLNLAIINFLPLPALDGGRFLFLIIAKLRKRAINQKFETLIHNIGFIFLIFLIILISFHDFKHYQEVLKNFWQNIF